LKPTSVKFALNFTVIVCSVLWRSDCPNGLKSADGLLRTVWQAYSDQAASVATGGLPAQSDRANGATAIAKVNATTAVKASAEMTRLH
jgi:hypothetical protein